MSASTYRPFLLLCYVFCDHAFLCRRNFISVLSTTSLHEALKTMATNKLTSVPVEDAGERGSWLGFLDVLDVAACVLRVLRADDDVHSKTDDHGDAPYDWTQWEKSLTTLEHRGVRLEL